MPETRLIRDMRRTHTDYEITEQLGYFFTQLTGNMPKEFPEVKVSGHVEDLPGTRTLFKAFPHYNAEYRRFMRRVWDVEVYHHSMQPTMYRGVTLGKLVAWSIADNVDIVVADYV